MTLVLVGDRDARKARKRDAFTSSSGNSYSQPLCMPS